MLRLLVPLLFLFLSACAQNPAQVEIYPSGDSTQQRAIPGPSHRSHVSPRLSGEETLSAPQVALINQAEKHLALKQANLAASKLERAIRINPHAVKPYRLLAELRLQQGSFHVAADFARKGLAVIVKKGSPRNFRREKARLEAILSAAQGHQRG